EYGVFFRDSGTAVDSVIVNLAVGDLAPIPELPVLLTVSIPLLDPGTQGLGTASERRLLNELEAELVGALAHELHALFIGRVLGHGLLVCSFQAPEGTLAHSCVSAVLREFPSYNHFQLDAQDDPDWEMYFIDLYPNRTEFQTMANHSRQAMASERGNRLEVPRPICHWAYFPNIACRNAFLLRIAAGGFRARLRESLDADEFDSPFCVELMRLDRADHPYLDQLVLNLFSLAEECGGYYDGYVADVFAVPAG
ncbi:MAG: hypothetical protein JWM11_140, partial [Planctomycetaceae bacterium]|nr:hypothetical protein [Planctomycetaceae bacterium]